MNRRKAFSLVEILLAVAVMVAVTTVTIKYVMQPRDRISNNACQLGRSELQLRVDEYFRTNGRFPSTNLRELATGTSPLPICPVDGQAFQLDVRTGLVGTHVHPN